MLKLGGGGGAAAPPAPPPPPCGALPELGHSYLIQSQIYWEIYWEYHE